MNKIPRAILTASVLASTAGNVQAASAAPALPADVQSRVDAIFAGISPRGPGCATGVYRDGKLVLSRGYGLANVELGVPITPATVFDIGSVSKQFTAMAVILLAHDGKIALDDDIRKYLPEIRDYGTRITIRNLLNHSSGIPDFLNLFFIKGYDERDAVALPEILDMLARQDRLMFAPGSAFSYSNSGYILLAEIVARTAGQPFSRFAEERIFRPLGMTDTHVHDDAGRVVPRRAYAYHGDPASGLTAGGSNFAVPGDGAVYTTVDDLRKWDEDFYRGVVWKPAVKADMLHVARLPDGKPIGSSATSRYASGIGIGTHRGLDVIRHGGSWAGYVADFVRFPRQHVSVSVLCNFDGVDPMDLTDKIADMFLEPLYTQPPKTAANERDDGEDGLPVPVAILDAIAGHYYSEQIDAEYVVRRKGASLIFEAGARRTPFDFAAMGVPLRQQGGATLATPLFRLNYALNDGRVQSFTIAMDRIGPVRFTRKPD